MNDHHAGFPPEAAHPDADLWSAFFENTLPPLERAVALEHLAVCERCRTVLALSLPAQDETLPAPKPADERWWTRRPVWSIWVGVLAMACLALISVRLVHPPPPASSPATMARMEPQAAVPAIPAEPSSNLAAMPLLKRRQAMPAAINPQLNRKSAPAALRDNAQSEASGIAGRDTLAKTTPGGPETQAAAASPVTPAAQPLQRSRTAVIPNPAPAPMAQEAYNSGLASKEPANIALPGGQAAVSVASLGSRKIAVDANGGVFLTRDGGRSWVSVTRAWPGRAQHVQLSGAAAGFTLVTVQGERWTSADGERWTLLP